MIIGITGGSGTGKSSACTYFDRMGYVIIDADTVAREVCAPGTECLAELVAYFGGDIVDGDGTLMRKKLGSLVFADSSKLMALNEITHKHIIKSIKEKIADNEGRDIVVDAPLLLETGLDSLCDVTLCVISSADNRISRIMARDGISAEDAQNRIQSQKDDSYYISRCDHTVTNNGSPDELIHKLSRIFGGDHGK